MTKAAFVMKWAEEHGYKVTDIPLVTLAYTYANVCGFLTTTNDTAFDTALAHYALVVGKRRQLALKVQQMLDVSEQSRLCLLLARAALAWADEQVDAAHAVLVAEGSR